MESRWEYRDPVCEAALLNRGHPCAAVNDEVITAPSSTRETIDA